MLNAVVSYERGTHVGEMVWPPINLNSDSAEVVMTGARSGPKSEKEGREKMGGGSESSKANDSERDRPFPLIY